MDTAEQLKMIMQLSGLTQAQLAALLGVSFPTMNSWINRRSAPRKAAAQRIQALFLQTSGLPVSQPTTSAKRAWIDEQRRNYGSVFDRITKNSDIADSLVLALTYHSNRIEGSTLTEKETQAVLFDNVAVPRRSLTEQIEARNHRTAWELLLDQFQSADEPITETMILRLHTSLMNGVHSDAGYYRSHPVRITGSSTVTANYLKVPALMEQWIIDANAVEPDILAQAAVLHSRFEQIHPFADGNGRLGRLLLQAQLLRHNYPPAIIQQQRRRTYYDALERSQVQGGHDPLIEFIADAVIVGLKLIERG